jgi:crotonobetainyl-CoA:carnitine CoA-transferase CaiB-like acyl-CoA transferase
MEQQTAEEWLHAFKNEDVCCNLVSTVEESHRALPSSPGSPLPMIPLPLSPTFLVQGHEAQRPPTLGEHTHLFDEKMRL